MELLIGIAIATLGLGVAIGVILKHRTQDAGFSAIVERLTKLEADKELFARLGLQVGETFNASKQLVAGFNGIQGQLSDFTINQRAAGESVAELKSALPGLVGQGIQAASTALQEIISRQIMPALTESSNTLSQGNVQAANRFREQAEGLTKSFGDLQRILADAVIKGLQEIRIELNAASQASSVEKTQRHQELDGKLAQYRQEVESKLQTNSESVQQLIQAVENRFTVLAQTTTEAIGGIRESVGGQIKEMREEAGMHRTEVSVITKAAIDSLEGKVTKLTDDNTVSIENLRRTVEERLQTIQTQNATKLEEMRLTVDEKLHATLEQRLGESFKLVSDRLEQVHRGLGEMQTLASGVGDLKRVLTNVKARGTWGEMQLSQLLEQVLTADQFMTNVATKPGSQDRVEFAIRLPGKDDSQPVLLPIDAKFPIEDYQRLTDAQERADVIGVEEASKALEARIKGEAKTISEKYINPPHTTDFALLYLPIEGLYAEVLRRPGLCDTLQRAYRVTVAGPTTLTAILNSLQMGFRTLAIEKRSSEVWTVLGAIKTEFVKFGQVIDATKKKLEAATNQFDQVDVRTRAIQKQLKGVEALPVLAASQLIGIPVIADDVDEINADLAEVA